MILSFWDRAFDRTCKAKRHRPDCGFARPIEDVVDGGGEHALFKSVLKQGGHLISVIARVGRHLERLARLLHWWQET
jgi:hypothetical protein